MVISVHNGFGGAPMCFRGRIMNGHDRGALPGLPSKPLRFVLVGAYISMICEMVIFERL